VTSPPAARGSWPTRRAGVGLTDLHVAGAVALLTVIGLGVSVADDFPFLAVDPDTQSLLPEGRAVLEAVAEAAPLVFRRIAPLRVFGLVAGVSLLDEALNRHPEPLPLAVLVALYTLAVMRRPLVAVIAAAGYVAALALDAATAWTDVTDDQLYVDLLAVAGTVTLGCWTSLDRMRADAAEQRTRDVTRTVAATAQAAVDRERARIAREMHDVLGSQLSLIVAQASTTRRVFADRPEATAEALGSIESVGRDALSGLRRVVGLLRADRGRPPKIDGLDALVGQLDRAGLPAQLVVHGNQRPLAAEIELTAFRIVQEALTNSLKHAGASGVTITLSYGDDALVIDVTDAGPCGAPGPVPPPRAPADDAPHRGFGLVGMHQRVELLGGGLAAGPVGGGGFRVRACLPLAAAPAAEGAEPA
jgi:signal transduction histidine kinase